MLEIKIPPSPVNYVPEKTINTLRSRNPVEILSIEYDVPMPLACLMVSRDGEKQTAENIKMFKEYIEFIVNESRKRKRI